MKLKASNLEKSVVTFDLYFHNSTSVVGNKGKVQRKELNHQEIEREREREKCKLGSRLPCVHKMLEYFDYFLSSLVYKKSNIYIYYA